MLLILLLDRSRNYLSSGSEESHSVRPSIQLITLFYLLITSLGNCPSIPTLLTGLLIADGNMTPFLPINRVGTILGHYTRAYFFSVMLNDIQAVNSDGSILV